MGRSISDRLSSLGEVFKINLRPCIVIWRTENKKTELKILQINIDYGR